MRLPNAWTELTFGSPDSQFSADGYYDDVRVYDRALSTTEVLQLVSNTAKIHTPPSAPSQDLARNWRMSRSYDENGNVVGESKSFTDALGRGIQSQVKNQTAGHILATQTVYSSGGKPVLSTLAAPINNAAFSYKEKFFTVGGYDYGPINFEGAKSSNPDVPDYTGIGTLRYYYSSQNALEPLTPATAYPFSLTEEYGGPLGGIKRAAGPGEVFRMGAGRETKSRELPMLNELDHYLSMRSSFVPTPTGVSLKLQGLKSISVDTEGKESISFADKEGQVLATCLSGPQYTGVVVEAAIHSDPANTSGLPVYQDIHIPAAGPATLTIGGDGSLDILNLTTDAVTSYSYPWPTISLAPGFYRVLSTRNNQSVRYLARYGDFSYSFYDDARRVVATVAPRGVGSLATQAGNAPTGRVGQWSFNEGTGVTTAESSGNPLSGTLLNGAAWTASAGTSGTLCGLKTEHQGTLDLNAPAGTRITGIKSARYGTGQGNDCASFTFDPACSADVTDRVSSLAAAQLANNPAVISISADNNTLGIDPCGGQVKVLKIEATYIPSNPLTSPAGGSCVLFDGQDDYVRVGDAPALRMTNTLTLEAWIYPTANKDGIILNKENEYEVARFADGSIQWAFANTNPGWAWVNTGIVVPLNTWAHIGITYDNGVVKAYLNGVQVGTAYAGAGSIRYNGGEFWIGGRQCCPQFFQGALDEVRVWNTIVQPSTSSTTQPAFTTRYTYSGVGTLLSTESVDKGKSEYVYARDGRIRFSQSALQKQQGRFSYSNYDEVGRVVESGEYTMATDLSQGFVFENHLTASPRTNSVLQLLEDRTPSGGLDQARCSQRNQVWYDEATGDVPDPDRTQEFVLGAVAKTSNGSSTTWYSYDDQGRVTWLVQQVPGVGKKTVDYTYDFLGNVLEVAYQKGQPDAFYHQYEYDADKRLRSVYTSTDGLPTSRTLQARYHYYLHGPLKRVELAGNLQGLDYAYTVQGWLKSINNAQKGLDPGQDSPASTGMLKDLFGMRLDYFDGDYRSRQLTAPNLTSSTSQPIETHYDGSVRANSWHTAAATKVHSYAYRYDAKGQLLQSDYGELIGGSLLQYNTDPNLKPFEEGNLSYDAHGNIQTMRRRDGAGFATDDFTYEYTPGTNKLARVKNQAGNAELEYEYDVNGQMTRELDYRGGRSKFLSYDVTGKVTGVYRDAARRNLLATYTYDDRGFRSSKSVYDSNGYQVERITTYVRDAAGNVLGTYEQGAGKAQQLTELPLYGSSRLGMLTRVEDNTGTNAFDARYELNDQLGNARVVFHRPTTATYLATMEDGQRETEESQFENLPATRVAGVAWQGSYSARIRSSGAPVVGPKKTILNVQKGDTVTFSSMVHYAANNQGRPAARSITPYAVAGAMVAGVPQGVAQPTPEGTSRLSKLGQALSRLTAGVSLDLLGQRVARTASLAAVPPVYLRYRLYDPANNQTIQEGTVNATAQAGMAWEELKTGVRMSQGGNLELTTVSASFDNDAFFDQITVEHTGGAIVQEQHQYAFGSPLTGLNYVVGNKRYRHGYQGQFTEKDEETGYDSFELRLYNSRIGRWMSYDPEGQFYSPYVGMGNNPVSDVDPDGGLSHPPGTGLSKLKNINSGYMKVATDATSVSTRTSTGLALVKLAASQRNVPDVTEKFDNQLKQTWDYFSDANEKFNTAYNQAIESGNGKNVQDVLVERIKFFSDKVKTGAPFDIKQKGKGYTPRELGGEFVRYHGIVMRYDDFGNYNYGLAAKAFGISLEFAKKAAGLNQLSKIFSRPSLVFPTNIDGLFDDPRDTQMIIRGYSHPMIRNAYLKPGKK